MTFEHFSLAVLAELTGGFIFLFLVLILLKPRVRIAKFICVGKFPPVGEGNFYSFKLVNMSFFSAHEIKIELHQMQRIPMANKKINQKYTQLTLLSDTISHIRGRPFQWSNDNASQHCVVIRSKENITEILRVETNAILLKVCLQHGLTGFTGVYQMEFCTEGDIKEGKFIPGTKFGTI